MQLTCVLIALASAVQASSGAAIPDGISDSLETSACHALLLSTARETWRGIEEREARWIELGDRAVQCPDETAGLADMAQELWEQDYFCAREALATIDPSKV